MARRISSLLLELELLLGYLFLESLYLAFLLFAGARLMVRLVGEDLHLEWGGWGLGWSVCGSVSVLCESEEKRRR